MGYKSDKLFKQSMSFSLPADMVAELQKLPNRSAFVEEAISEKMEEVSMEDVEVLDEKRKQWFLHRIGKSVQDALRELSNKSVEELADD